MKTRHQEGATEDSSANTSEFRQKTNQTSLERQKDSSSDWTKKRVGGFWIKEDKLGSKYLSGSIITEEGKVESFHIYKNRSKSESSPDKVCYKIFGDSKREEVGGFWVKKNKNGRDYLSGVIRGSNNKQKSLHIYPNDFRQGGQPLYNCYIFS